MRRNSRQHHSQSGYGTLHIVHLLKQCMIKVHNKNWELIFLNKRQKAAWTAMYANLDLGYRWQVDCALNYMVVYEKPWSRYRHVKCSECVDGTILLDVSHEGIGDKKVEVLVRFDEVSKAVTPLYCKLV